jgi:uncharacterized protein (UPF0218 family)
MTDLRPVHRYLMPESVRAELARAFGPVVSTEYLSDTIADTPFICVGDQVSLTTKEAGLTPKVIVCDYRTRRGNPTAAYIAALGGWGQVEIKVQNAAGELRRAAWDAVVKAVNHPGPYPVRVTVDGEEDLLGIPCFLEAPDGWKVLYGMPGQGVCVVTLDAIFKRQVRQILLRFNQE